MFIQSQNIILIVLNYILRTEGKVIFLPWGNLVGTIIKEVTKYSIISSNVTLWAYYTGFSGNYNSIYGMLFS